MIVCWDMSQLAGDIPARPTYWSSISPISGVKGEGGINYFRYAHGLLLCLSSLLGIEGHEPWLYKKSLQTNRGVSQDAGVNLGVPIPIR